ncbi:hypothetical protein ADL22_12440 [Streptomyces sp. NRRL F-4489]|uniref:hypothetical protein n=1 Tax=Streptomyces sp. NRRL F-4489 TaxID=1609095 RepID=UPI000748F3CE|nr:hypothetical protein [Streptomyces sp. NRRL F-4489]KUL44746.1 hypothetical protein ADL22_12440 [Streptomyces sp. NRRL F-4489]
MSIPTEVTPRYLAAVVSRLSTAPCAVRHELVLDSPKEALLWLDAVVQELLSGLPSEARRPVIRGLRASLGRRGEWLDGYTSAPYDTVGKGPSFWVVGRVREVSCLRLDIPCLLLEVAP